MSEDSIEDFFSSLFSILVSTCRKRVGPHERHASRDQRRPVRGWGGNSSIELLVAALTCLCQKMSHKPLETVRVCLSLHECVCVSPLPSLTQISIGVKFLASWRLFQVHNSTGAATNKRLNLFSSSSSSSEPPVARWQTDKRTDGTAIFACHRGNSQSEQVQHISPGSKPRWRGAAGGYCGSEGSSRGLSSIHVSQDAEQFLRSQDTLHTIFNPSSCRTQASFFSTFFNFLQFKLTV